MNDLECPYCFEKDLDLTGLKIHLLKYCLEFETYPSELTLVKPIKIKPIKIKDDSHE